MRPAAGRLGVAGLAALTLALFLVHRPLLEIRLEEGPVVWREALAPGEPIVLSYRHSVTGQPVREEYVLDRGGRLRVREHAYRLQGAGLGQREGEGRTVEAPGGWTRVLGLDRDVGHFTLRVGQGPQDHRLQVRGRQMELSRTLAGRRLWIGGRPARLWEWLRHRRPAAPPTPAPWEETP
ncbi:MAG: DUF1850 domain-containing protein [Deferrisomatales bacterium]|nr:DUF1850 domain-containing protein [Deferrisomatales bacterium]